MDQKVSHPLTGPIFVEGAQPGDLLEVEYVDIFPEPCGWTRFRPGAGFLRDVFTQPFVAHWSIEHGYATSEQIPGVRIPDGSFMGTAGVAPSHDQLETWARREQELLDRGGVVQPPDIEDAVPGGRIGEEGPSHRASTRERRQHGHQATHQRFAAVHSRSRSRGLSSLLETGTLPRETVKSASPPIEMGATVGVRFKVHKREADRKNIRTPRFSHPGYFLPPDISVPRNFTATMGYPIREDGTQEGEDVTLAARNALLDMIDLLCDRGYSAEQAYAICSVAVDLRISNIVDLPNVTVSAFLPEDIFVR